MYVWHAVAVAVPEAGVEHMEIPLPECQTHGVQDADAVSGSEGCSDQDRSR